MKRQLILIAATWAAMVGLVAGSAHAQSPTPAGRQLVVVGVVMLEGGRGLAFVQDPTFTDNKVVTVRVGDSVGPYRVTKILTHQVELTGPGGTMSVPLAGLPGAVGVASSAGTGQPPAGEAPPSPELSTHNVIELPRGDPRRHFKASQFLVGAGAVVGPEASQPWQPQVFQSRAASAQDVPVPAATQARAADPPLPAISDPRVIVLPRGDSRRHFPAAQMLIGAQ